jgi:hypothetical protein
MHAGRTLLEDKCGADVKAEQSLGRRPAVRSAAGPPAVGWVHHPSRLLSRVRVHAARPALTLHAPLPLPIQTAQQSSARARSVAPTRSERGRACARCSAERDREGGVPQAEVGRAALLERGESVLSQLGARPTRRLVAHPSPMSDACFCGVCGEGEGFFVNNGAFKRGKKNNNVGQG